MYRNSNSLCCSSGTTVVVELKLQLKKYVDWDEIHPKVIMVTSGIVRNMGDYSFFIYDKASLKESYDQCR